MNVNIEEYNKKFDQVKKGEITEKEWSDFCLKITMEKIRENKDVFIRLKNM